MANKAIVNNYDINEEAIDYRELLRKILNKWYLFGFFGLLGIIGSYTFNKIIQPKYEIKATLYSMNNNQNVGTINLFESLRLRPPANIQNHVGMLNSYSLISQALENLDWQVTWYENKIFSYIDIYKYSPFKIENFNPLLNLPNVLVNVSPQDNEKCIIHVHEKLRIGGIEKNIEFEQEYTYGDTIQNEYFNFVLNKEPGRSIDFESTYAFKFNDINKSSQVYKDKLQISLVNEDADLIQLSTIGNQPEREIDFINELSQVYINFGLREKNRKSENTVNFIDSQLIGVVDSLQSAGRSFTNFRSRNRILDVSQEAGIVIERLEELESEEAHAQMKLEYYQNLLTYLGDADKMEQVIAPSVVGITDPALNTMVVSLGELYNRRSNLSFSVQDKNPSLLALENEIRYMRQSLEENLRNLISNAEIQLESLKESKGEVNRELARLPKTEQDLGNIKRQFDLNNELYTYLLQKRAEAAITKASNLADVRVLDIASLDTTVQLGPNKLLNYIIGLVLGLGIPLLIISIIHYFDQTIKSKEDIEKETSIPVLGVIGHSKDKSDLPLINNPYSGVSESFRILRTQLDYIAGGNDQKVICLHSIIPSEGKTFCAVNLAYTIALNNKNVLLIAADLRKPKIHKIFNLSNEKGLSTYLINKDKIDDIVSNTKIKNLNIITSGPIPPNPAELLGNEYMSTLIEKSREYFDYIIIDNAPAALVADASIVAKYSDINLFITRTELTNRKHISLINQFNQQKIINNVYIVLNDIFEHKLGYRKYNGKGYGIYSEIKPKKNKDSKLMNI